MTEKYSEEVIKELIILANIGKDKLRVDDKRVVENRLIFLTHCLESLKCMEVSLVEYKRKVEWYRARYKSRSDFHYYYRMSDYQISVRQTEKLLPGWRVDIDNNVDKLKETFGL
jgi:hypothetical protein